ncbi:MAG: CotH kinase family protein [Fibrobacter sp.]|nr:CotH kinase family protein [Fibrobacter sp.]
MQYRQSPLLTVWITVLLSSACVSMIACSNDSDSNSPNPIAQVDDPAGGDGSILVSSSSGDQNGNITGSTDSQPGSSAYVDPVTGEVVGSSGSAVPASSTARDFSAKDSHEGLLPGEDTTQVPLTEPPPYVGNFPVVFSEVSPSNASLKDEDGNDPGWLELYNTSDSPVDLSGIALSNDLKFPRRWTFGKAVIPAKSYMVVFMSGKNLPDYTPPSDSIDMVSTNCHANESAVSGMGGFDFAGMMGGGMMGGDQGANQGGVNMGGNTGTTTQPVSNLPGQSALCFNQNGANMFGAILSVPAGASNASFVVNPSTTNLSKINQLVLKGYISKGHKVRLNLNDNNGSIGSWSGKNLKGTGDSTTEYSIRLGDNAMGVNLANVSGTTFFSESQAVENTEIKIFSYIARNRGREPHTTFKVDKDGGALYLVNTEGGILDSVRYNAVPVTATWSMNTAGKWGIGDPSPYGATLGEVSATQVASSEASVPPSGFYSSPLTVTLPQGTRCATGGAEPTETSGQITQSLNISSTTVLRCITYAEGAYRSDMLNRTYIFENQPSLPALFVTTDPLSMFSADTGLYMTGDGAQMMDPHKGANYWSNRELPVYVELVEPGAKQPGFGIMGDFKISGQYSRAKEKKSFSVTFREQYGDKRLKYNLFPDHPELTKFKAFSVRNFGNNCGNDYVRDRVGTQITEGLDVDYQRGRYVIVYYNGAYYGIHDMRERNNEYYYETKYGIDGNDIDLLDANDEATAGSSADYVAMMDWLQSNTNSLKEDANFNKVAEQIDIDNYINYMQTEMFINNRDWPHNNLKKWRVASKKTKWKWFIYDTDFGFGTNYSMNTTNIFSYVTSQNGTQMAAGFGMGGGGNGTAKETLLLRKLLENASFARAFVNRFVVLLSSYFTSERILKMVNDLQSQVQSEMARDQEFWGFNASSMDQDFATITNFASSRQQQVTSEMESFFGLADTGVQMTIGTSGSGEVLVDGLPLGKSSLTAKFYSNVPVTLIARATNGAVFSSWSDGVTDAKRTVSPGQVTTITAQFK